MTAWTRRTFLGGVLATPLMPWIVLGQANAQGESAPMRIRFKFHDQDFTATLSDNASAREFAAMLPLDVTIEDFSSNEKIAHLPRKLTELSRGPFEGAAPGDLCYYVPWGNLAFFHDRYESTRDLVPLGRLDGGIEPLLTRGEFKLRIDPA
jgi:hypothetical protein